MALTAEQIAAQLDSLKKARNSGVLIVRHGDESTQFRSLAEMDKIIASLEGQLATTKRKRVRYIQESCKGY